MFDFDFSLETGWDTRPNTGWNDTNITAGVVDDSVGMHAPGGHTSLLCSMYVHVC